VTPPLAVDIDGTLTDADRAVDPRVLPVLREWDAPVVIATGKAFPYPVALCEVVGIEPTVIAENGGVVAVGETDEIVFTGDPEGARAVAEAYRELGHDLGFGGMDLANRWRETEVIVHRDAPLEPLERLADEHGLEVVDTGFAYHVKATDVNKGVALEAVADELGREVTEFVAVGDSENDAAMFERVGRAYAVANADERARATADVVLDESYGDGFLAAVDRTRDGKGTG
jgi:phosphoglycolate phosphatase (TIGR01487 family)